MKIQLAIALIATLPGFAQTAAEKPARALKQTPSAAKKAAAKAPAKAAPRVAEPLVIPKDATPNPDGTYSWSDKKGKKWLFSRSPFGVSKIEDLGPQQLASKPPAGQFVKAFEDGDKVRFERQTPFGATKWEKNKADLNEEERAILTAQQAAAAPAQKPE